MAERTSGDGIFTFALRPDLYSLPETAGEYEVDLHGGFARDERAGYGQIYYGMPGCGIMRIDPDLRRQEVIPLPPELTPVNFHSTKIGDFDGRPRLILPANNDEIVAILTLDGDVDYILPRPVFDAYRAEETPYRPTDTVLVNERLYIADGYGANFISTVDINTQNWDFVFGGKTDDATENGKFATAHGIGLNPHHGHLDIADRPHSRIQAHGLGGAFVASHRLPAGAFLCGISYAEYDGRTYAAIGCLQDPDEGRPAPIYIIDAVSYELLSIVRPKEELGVEPAQHLHNVLLLAQGQDFFLVCQSWNPGHYFVLQKS